MRITIDTEADSPERLRQVADFLRTLAGSTSTPDDTDDATMAAFFSSDAPAQRDDRDDFDDTARIVPY